MLTFLFTTPARSGQGSQVIPVIPSGPVPNDDYVTVTLTETSTGNLICQGQAICHGSLTPTVYLGHQERFGGVDFGTFNGVAQGAAVTVHAYQWHANNTLVDQSIDTPWGVLDSLANGFSLLHWIAASNDADVQAILAAVQRTYSNA